MANKKKYKKVTYTKISPDVQKMDYRTYKSKKRGDKFVEKATKAVGYTDFANKKFDGSGTRTKVVRDKDGKVIKRKTKKLGTLKVAKLI